MAIEVQEKKGNSAVIKIVVAVVSLAVILAAVYYLFFSVTPLVEVVAPPEFETVSQFSNIQIDPSSIVQSGSFQTLREHVGEPELGEFGRDNPFTRF